MDFIRKGGVFLLFLILLVPTISAQIDVNHMEYISVFASNDTGHIEAVGDYTLGHNFTLQPPDGEVWFIARMITTLQDTGTPSANEYGVLTITNGWDLYYDNHEMIKITAQEDIKSITDLAHYSYDVNYLDFGTGNAFSLINRWTFTKGGVYIKLNGSTNDSLIIAFHDDYSGLEHHAFQFQGYKLNSSRISQYPEENMDTTTAFGMGFSTLIFVMGLLMVLSLIGFAYFRNKAFKTMCVGAAAFSLLYILRFASWFIEIVNPDQLELIDSTARLYGFSVYILKAIIYISIGAALIFAVAALRDTSKKKTMPDFEKL